MVHKKYIRRKITKLQSCHEAWPGDALGVLLETIEDYKKRYKYIQFGVTTNLKEQYDRHYKRDAISWSGMRVKFISDNPEQVSKFVRETSKQDNYIDNNITFPTTLFDEHPTYYIYILVGKRKKTSNLLSKNMTLKVGTLFSGIGAFEHALNQLHINHKIQFACDNGERELPLTYGNLFALTQAMNDDELREYCENYINKIGVKREYRDIECDLLYQAAHKQGLVNEDSPVDAIYHKEGRKSAVKHRLILTQEQIIALTPNMTMKEREVFVNGLYDKMGVHNYVKDAYFANYDITEKKWHEDIRFLDAKEFEGDLDIMVGGSPCQSFSNYGKKLGLEDVRGTLFYDYARVISESKPKIFIYENVENVTKNDGGKTWKVMFDVWQSLGYHIEWSILDARDYNHPQLRTRLFLIGFREDIYKEPYTFPEKMKLTHKSTEYLEEGPIPNIYYLGKKGFEWITTPAKNLRRSRVNQDVIGCETANQQDNWIGDFRVEHPQPQHYADERIYIGKYDFNDGKGMVDAVGRKMTPRECMNLMGFDNTFKFAVNDSIAYRHAGNSIVVPVLKELIKSLILYLK